jgi:hypothetical protein
VFTKQLKQDKNTSIACLIILVLSIVLEWYGRYCGFILTSDSLQYLSAAKSFSESGKFLSPDGSSYAYWPPLFPVLLSWGDPFIIVSSLHVVSKIIIATIMLYLAFLFFQKSLYRIVFLTASLLSVQYIMISVFLWTELLFMCLLFGNAFFALNLKKKKYFYWFLLTGFLLCLQRNAGLFWVSGVSVWMMVDQENTFLKNFLKATLYFLVSTSGFWAWNIYNTFFIPTDFNFYQHSFLNDWVYNVGLIAQTYVYLIIPLKHIPLSVMVFCTATLLVVYILRNSIDRKLLLFVITLATYTAGYSIMPTLDVYEMDRYFSVMTPLIFLMVLLATEKLSQYPITWMKPVMAILVVCWLAYPLARTVKNVRSWHDRSCTEVLHGVRIRQ